MRTSWFRPALGGFLLAAVACADEVDETELVARVNDYTFTVDQAVELLVDEENLAADANVVTTLANFWVDYVLLAEEAQRDTMFERLDLEPMVERQLFQQMVFALRDSVIQVDTFITEGELETLYEAEAPEVDVRARHIMMTYPVQATPAQRDSVRAALQSVRDRVAAGASFESMARQFSQDRGTAATGGDLGYFARGEMVAPFEEAAFALQPGQVSEVVETPLGLHLIKVDDRRTLGFEEAAADFRLQVQEQRVQAAESTFVTAIEDRVDPQIVDGALELVREMSRDPSARLSRGAARRPVIEWNGGAVSVGELQTLLRLEPAILRQQLAAADDETLELFVEDLARRELLIEEARSAGLQPGRASIDSMVVEAGDQLREAARMLGFMDLDQAPGEPRELAIARAVEEALRDNLTGAVQFVPLGLVSFQLRDRASFSIYDAGIGQAIVRIGQLRAQRMLAPADQPTEPVAQPDTVG